MKSAQNLWANSPYRNAQTGPFNLTSLFRFPERLEHPEKDAISPVERISVAVLGGGVAGLSAAYELALRGYRVVVSEATGRWGGRIYTRYFKNGTYGELGAMRIPPTHGCVHHYIDRFGLKTRRFVSRNEKGWYWLRGEKARRCDWVVVAAKYALPMSWGISPDQIEGQIVQKAAGLIRDEKRLEQFANDLSDPFLRQLESISLIQFVRGIRGKLEGVLPTDEVWEYAGRGTLNTWIENTSVLHWLREGSMLSDPNKQEIEGGMSQLVHGFVKSLQEAANGTKLRLNTKVLEIRMMDSGVEVTTQSEIGIRKEEFDYVICALPAAAVTRVLFEPALPGRQFEALSGLSYFNAGKTLMHCRTRHWETVDGICGGQSISDVMNQQCWYPSDNAEPDPEGLGGLGRVVDRTTDLNSLTVEPSLWKARNDQVSQGPGVFLAAYMWGNNALRFASMTPDERTDTILSNVRPLHPKNEQYLDEVVHWSWDEQSNPGGGAFGFFAPAMQQRYQKALCTPVLGLDGRPRVLFAGEHLGIAQGWIQSAIQTASAAVIDVVDSNS